MLFCFCWSSACSRQNARYLYSVSRVVCYFRKEGMDMKLTRIRLCMWSGGVRQDIWQIIISVTMQYMPLKGKGCSRYGTLSEAEEDFLPERARNTHNNVLKRRANVCQRYAKLLRETCSKQPHLRLYNEHGNGRTPQERMHPGPSDTNASTKREPLKGSLTRMRPPAKHVPSRVCLVLSASIRLVLVSLLHFSRAGVVFCCVPGQGICIVPSQCWRVFAYSTSIVILTDASPLH
ncbi:hypothetical protein B0J14DRAFT_123240 [Halenospora varia]|nr:hypothetical protein B0J14DRAFT_123240 [Halenospora varia]